MLSTLGNVLQAIALVLALASAVLLIAGAKLAPIPVGTSHATSAPGRAHAASRMRDLGYMLTYVTFALLTACVAIILFAMLTEDYTLAYVVSNYPATDSPLQPLYRVSAVWAGRQGSLLLWTWLISAFAAAQAHRRRHAKDDLTVVALGVSHVVVALFAGALVFSASNNPFMPTAAQYLTADGGLVSKIGGMQPPAHALGHDLAPAGDLHRLRRHDPAVRLRHGFAHHRRPLGPLGGAVRPPGRVRLHLPVHRHGPRRRVGLRGPGLGRLLGVGRRGEREAS